MDTNGKTQSSSVKLNRRGKITVWGIIAVLFASVVFALMPVASAQSDVQQTESITVQPGDTLWSYASRVNPRGGDIYDTMDKIKQINHLESDQLQAGQALLVPIE